MSQGTRPVKWCCLVVLAAVALGACSDSGYSWTATPNETSAVSTAREMDTQLASVWVDYSDGLLLHYIYGFCTDLHEASDVESFLDETAEAQGEVVLLPLVVGSPYLCAERSDEIGDWIARHAAAE